MGDAGRGVPSGSDAGTNTDGAIANDASGLKDAAGMVADAGPSGPSGTDAATSIDGAAGRDASSPKDAASAADAARPDAGNPANTTIWIAGDSTVMTYPAGNTDGTNMTSLEGWGQELGQFFDSRVTINNQAIGGRSVAFFMWAVQTDSTGAYECVDDQGNPQYQLDAAGNHVDTAQWARIKSGIKAGDFLLIQFGTNDETHTCPRFVSLTDFETDFGIMADAVRAKGATPIFVTPMGHRSFSGTTVTNTLLPYANAMKDEATKETVEVEDLNLRSEEYYQSVGNTFLASNIFDGGTTHFIKAGATEMASLIAGEVRRNGGQLAAYLK